MWVLFLESDTCKLQVNISWSQRPGQTTRANLMDRPSAEAHRQVFCSETGQEQAPIPPGGGRRGPFLNLQVLTTFVPCCHKVHTLHTHSLCTLRATALEGRDKKRQAVACDRVAGWPSSIQETEMGCGSVVEVECLPSMLQALLLLPALM